MTEAQRREWHQNKWTIISIVVGFVLQTVGFAWWGSGFVTETKSEIASIKSENATIAIDRAKDREAGARRDQAIVRLETQFGNIDANLRGLFDAMRSMNDKLDRLVERARDRP